jgi:perosamine synthetase
MIPVSTPDLGDLERRYLLDAFDSGWISSLGPYLERAEERLRTLTGAPFAATCSNGTTALHLALLAAGAGPGDEIIVPSLTYIATLNAVYYVGATPIVVDVDEQTWCIDPVAVAAAITPSTKVIIAVDLYGQPADYTNLRKIAEENGLILVADAAESIGSSQNGKRAGVLADISTFSFFGNKVITSGEGGAVTCNSETVHGKVLQLRNQGNNPTKRYQHDVLGYNYRMTNLSAAILTAQLERAPELIDARRVVFEAYESLLSNDSRVQSQRTGPGITTSPWMYSTRLSGLTRDQRDEVLRVLSTKGVEARPVFGLVQEMPFVHASARSNTPVAKFISAEGISLPTFPGLQIEQIRHIVDALTESLDAANQTHPAGH